MGSSYFNLSLTGNSRILKTCKEHGQSLILASIATPKMSYSIFSFFTDLFCPLTSIQIKQRPSVKVCDGSFRVIKMNIIGCCLYFHVKESVSDSPSLYEMVYDGESGYKWLWRFTGKRVLIIIGLFRNSTVFKFVF